jgi:hypothetical protein
MQTHSIPNAVTVKIIANDRGNPAGKLADAELHLGGDSGLTGLKLIGFSIRERRGGAGRNVTFPARQYSVTAKPQCRAAASDQRRDRAGRRAGPHSRGVCRIRSLVPFDIIHLHIPPLRQLVDDMNGLQFLRILRRDHQVHFTSVALFSADRERFEHTEEATQLGALIVLELCDIDQVTRMIMYLAAEHTAAPTDRQ